MKITKKIIEQIFNGKKKLTKKKDIIELSKYNKIIPMYDRATWGVYPIKRDQLYYRLKISHYRFIEEPLIQWIINDLKKLEQRKRNNTENLAYKRLQLNLKILKNYDIDILYKTSIDTLYNYSTEIGLQISICKRNSFNPYFKHLNPYYTISELIKLGKNMELKTNLIPENLIDHKKHYEICKKVSKNDWRALDILNHTKYIHQNNGIGFTKLYSFYGSYLLNIILRNKHENNTSELIHNLGSNMLQLIKNAPVLEKEYIVYRFIWDDDFLKKLKINDIFIDDGFISTTRNPFYSASVKGHFGMILIKIHLPKNTKGLGILIENYSLFPREEEYILPPKSKLKLIGKDETFKYHHTNEEFEKQINKKYEFKLIESSDLNNISLKIITPDLELVELDKLELRSYNKLDKLSEFIRKYSNEHNQIKIKVLKKELIFYYHWFDSTGTYKKFYQESTSHGLSLSIFDKKSQLLLSIELGDELNINHQLRWVGVESDITDEEIIYITAYLALIFNYHKVLIHLNWIDFSRFEKNYSEELRVYLTIHKFPLDFYNYLKFGKKRFEKFDSVEPGFTWWKLDKLDEIKYKNDPELNISNVKTMKQAYLKVIETQFTKINSFEKKLAKLYDIKTNPFTKKYYIFRPFNYLKQKGIINIIPPIENINLEKIFSRDDYRIIYKQSFRNNRFLGGLFDKYNNTNEETFPLDNIPQHIIDEYPGPGTITDKMNNFFKCYSFKNKLLLTKTAIMEKHTTKCTLADLLSKKILQISQQNNYRKNIADCTASIGGNAISFLKYFSKVIAFEIDKITCKCLNSNLQLASKHFTNKSYEVVCNSFDYNLQEKINLHKIKIVFFDPPWGGPSVKNKDSINVNDIIMANKNMVQIVIELKNINLCVLKLPPNYNLKEFTKQIETNININRIESFYIYRNELISVNKLKINKQILLKIKMLIIIIHYEYPLFKYSNKYSYFLKHYGKNIKMLEKYKTKSKYNSNDDILIKMMKIYKINNLTNKWGYSQDINYSVISDNIQNIITKYINKNSKIADYGCGSGHNINYIKKTYNLQSDNVYCIDINDYRIKKNSKFIKNTNLNIINNNIKNDSIDLFIASQSLHHVFFTGYNYNQIINSIINTLNKKIKMGGYLFIREHDILNYNNLCAVIFEHLLYELIELKNKNMTKTQLLEWINNYSKQHDGIYFSKSVLKKLLAKYGFECIVIEDKKGYNPSRIYNILCKKVNNVVILKSKSKVISSYHGFRTLSYNIKNDDLLEMKDNGYNLTLFRKKSKKAANNFNSYPKIFKTNTGNIKDKLSTILKSNKLIFIVLDKTYIKNNYNKILTTYEKMKIDCYLILDFENLPKPSYVLDDIENILLEKEDIIYNGIISKKVNNDYYPYLIFKKGKKILFTKKIINQFNPKLVINHSKILYKKIHKKQKYNFKVFNDCVLLGGTKQRAIVPFISRITENRIVYVGPTTGFAQVALANALKILNDNMKIRKKLILYFNGSNLTEKHLYLTKNLIKIYNNILIYIYCRPNQVYQFNQILLKTLKSKEKFNVIGKIKGLTQLKNLVKEKEKKSYIVPFGLRFQGFVNLLAKQLINALDNNKLRFSSNIRIWLVIGSGAILNSLYKVFPNAEFFIVQIGQTVYDDILEKDRTTLKVYSEEINNKQKRGNLFLEDTNDIEDMPFNSVNNYDAKVWPIFKKYYKIYQEMPTNKIGGNKENYIWNVACIKTFKDIIK